MVGGGVAFLAPEVLDIDGVLQPIAAPSDVSRSAFAVIVLVVVLERLFEVWLSRRNARRVLARGGAEAGAGHYPVMVALHACFFVAALTEVLVFATRPAGWLTLVALAVMCGSMLLRYWAILSLGDRWNTRVVYEPGVAPVRTGPYRWLRHPNYVAVVLEIFFLPLIHGAWFTAVGFSVLNGLLLRHRIRIEESVVYGPGIADEVFAGESA